MSDNEAQVNEITALQSIYDGENVFFTTSVDGVIGGQFATHLQLQKPFAVQFEHEDGLQNYDVEYLPPIMLYFNLPNDYPSTSPPAYTLSCKWLTLTQLSQLCQELDRIWEENEGCEVLFTWISFLQDSCTDFLQLYSPLNLSHVVTSKRGKSTSEMNNTSNSISSASPSNHSNSSTSTCFSFSSPGAKHYAIDSRVVQDIGSQSLLLPIILEHNAEYRKIVFAKTPYECGVCFEEKMGSICLQFPGCGHVYCIECMQGHFTTNIEDGRVRNLTCPYGECQTQAHPLQVKKLVPLKLYKQYEKLLVQQSLDCMDDVAYCPRIGCSFAVIIDKTENMGNCPNCSYAFCVLCKKTYHGVEPCKIKSEELMKLRREYEEGTADEKQQLEKRYGRKVIRKAIEETCTNEWIEENSKKCPNCKTNIEKIDGCNKMTCMKCHTNFCWLCNTLIPASNPYSHFNSTSSKCFNLLFQGVVMDDFNPDEEFF